MRSLLLLLLALTAVVSATPLPEDIKPPQDKKAIAEGLDLRILPLGDSITYGHRSTDGNGYRRDLKKKLVEAGENATYIGSHTSGNMTNNQNEGWPGYEIDQVAVKANLSLSKRPNVVLLMVGVNDLRRDYNINTAPTRLGNLLDQIYEQCPDATIVLAQLTPQANKANEALGKTYSSSFPDMVSSRVSKGYKIVLVDMSNSKNGLTTADLADGLHPNDKGYAKMADVWFDGLAIASEREFITSPIKVPSCEE